MSPEFFTRLFMLLLFLRFAIVMAPSRIWDGKNTVP
jgi:hypothetical protein